MENIKNLLKPCNLDDTAVNSEFDKQAQLYSIDK